MDSARQRTAPKTATTSSKKKAAGSDLSSARGSEERHSSAPAVGRGQKRGRDFEIEKVGAALIESSSSSAPKESPRKRSKTTHGIASAASHKRRGAEAGISPESDGPPAKRSRPAPQEAPLSAVRTTIRTPEARAGSRRSTAAACRPSSRSAALLPPSSPRIVSSVSTDYDDETVNGSPSPLAKVAPPSKPRSKPRRDPSPRSPYRPPPPPTSWPDDSGSSIHKARKRAYKYWLADFGGGEEPPPRGILQPEPGTSGSKGKLFRSAEYRKGTGRKTDKFVTAGIPRNPRVPKPRLVGPPAS